MTEREINVKYIKNKFSDAKLNIRSWEELNLIADLMNERYIMGLRQGKFDVTMNIMNYFAEKQLKQIMEFVKNNGLEERLQHYLNHCDEEELNRCNKE